MFRIEFGGVGERKRMRVDEGRRRISSNLEILEFCMDAVRIHPFANRIGASAEVIFASGSGFMTFLILARGSWWTF